VNRDTCNQWIAWACRGILGGVFLYAAFPKIFDLKGFAAIIDAYGIVPERALVPVALILSLLEVVGGIGVLCRHKGYLSTNIIFGLLLLFIATLSYGLWLGLDIDCGCFGKDGPEYQYFHDLRFALYRDLFLLLPVLYLYWHGWCKKLKIKEILNDGR
jgi:uncharacterized membrane protein YphA (DoxX/SURF4 family)